MKLWDLRNPNQTLPIVIPGQKDKSFLLKVKIWEGGWTQFSWIKDQSQFLLCLGSVLGSWEDGQKSVFASHLSSGGYQTDYQNQK